MHFGFIDLRELMSGCFMQQTLRGAALVEALIEEEFLTNLDNL